MVPVQFAQHLLRTAEGLIMSPQALEMLATAIAVNEVVLKFICDSAMHCTGTMQIIGQTQQESLRNKEVNACVLATHLMAEMAQDMHSEPGVSWSLDVQKVPDSMYQGVKQGMASAEGKSGEHLTLNPQSLEEKVAVESLRAVFEKSKREYPNDRLRVANATVRAVGRAWSSIKRAMGPFERGLLLDLPTWRFCRNLFKKP